MKCPFTVENRFKTASIPRESISVILIDVGDFSSIHSALLVIFHPLLWGKTVTVVRGNIAYEGGGGGPRSAAVVSVDPHVFLKEKGRKKKRDSSASTRVNVTCND